AVAGRRRGGRHEGAGPRLCGRARRPRPGRDRDDTGALDRRADDRAGRPGRAGRDRVVTVKASLLLTADARQAQAEMARWKAALAQAEAETRKLGAAGKSVSTVVDGVSLGLGPLSGET